MMKLAPAAGLVLASPVVVGALQGRRHVDDALLAWLLAMVVAAAGFWLLQQVLVVHGPLDDGAESVEAGSSGEGSTGDGGAPERAPGTSAAGGRASPDSPPRRRRGDS